MARTLKRGSSGSDVKTLQTNLKKLGYYKSTIDGSFGPKTESAVKQFQRSVGLVVDGIVGPKTHAALNGRLKPKAAVVVKKAPATKTAAAQPPEIARWNNHKFEVSASKIYSFKSLQIKGSSELKDKKESGQGQVSRKGANPTEISMTVCLNAFTGCDVKKEAMAFISEAKDGKADYFYINREKLVACKLMLTDATVKEVSLSSKGTWKSAEVQLTMKQCDKGGSAKKSSGSGSGSSGSKGSSKKQSVKRSSPSSKKSTTGAKVNIKKINGLGSAALNAKKVKKATASIMKSTREAKKKSSSGGGSTRYALTR